jgi:hypothetical protein
VPRTRRSRSELDLSIGDAADAFGWLHHRARLPGLTRDGYPDGFPQHALVREGRLILVTFGQPCRRLAPNQRPWVQHLRSSRTIEVYVVSDGDLDELTSALQDAPCRKTPRGGAV